MECSLNVDQLLHSQQSGGSLGDIPTLEWVAVDENRTAWRVGVPDSSQKSMSAGMEANNLRCLGSAPLKERPEGKTVVDSHVWVSVIIPFHQKDIAAGLPSNKTTLFVPAMPLICSACWSNCSTNRNSAECQLGLTKRLEML